MSDLRKAAEMALEALEEAASCVQHSYLPDSMGHDWDEQIEALRQALAQPDLAKVGEVGVWGHKREWVGLTEDEVTDCFLDSSEKGILIEEAIEAKLKEKNA